MYGFFSFKEYRSIFGKVNVFNTTILKGYHGRSNKTITL